MLHNVLVIIYDTINESIKDITIPNGKNLLPSLLFSIIIAISTTVFYVLDIYCLINPIGAFIAVFLLIIVVSMERRSNSEILRLNRAVELHVEKIKGWKSRASESARRIGSAASDRLSGSETEGRDDSGTSDSVQRSDGSFSDSTGSERDSEFD